MKVQNEVLEYYKFLVGLRNSGATNMYGASAYLEEAYNLSRKDARDILSSWINSFSLPADEHPDDGRNDESHGEYDDYVEDPYWENS